MCTVSLLETNADFKVRLPWEIRLSGRSVYASGKMFSIIEANYGKKSGRYLVRLGTGGGTMHDPADRGRPATATLQVKIGGMSCSFCADTIRKALQRTAGVREAHVSLSHEETLVRYDPAHVGPDALRDTLRQLGYTIRDPEKAKAREEREREIATAKRRLAIAGGLTAVTISFMILMRLPAFRPIFVNLPVVLLTPVLALLTVFGTGGYIVKKAYYSLRRGILNQHVLLELGAFAGLAGGTLGLIGRFAHLNTLQFPILDFFAVAVFITTYHILSEYTSLLVRVRASRSVEKLLDLQAASARVIRGDDMREVPLAEIAAGDRVQIRPGESVPVDGKVTSGHSTVDESLVSGEPIPAEKTVGDEVVGGSMNRYGVLIVEVTRVGEETFLRQVARTIEEARAMKPGILQVTDAVLRYYVPAVLGFAALALVVWTLGAWALTGRVDIARAVFSALSVFVLGYPCALGMAAPLAMIRGGGIAASKGILMRSGEAFAVLKRITKVVFDKTGTLTVGRPAVVSVTAYRGLPESDLLAGAASIEEASEHPLARAVVVYAEEHGVQPRLVEHFEALPGRGARGTLDGCRWYLGSPAFFEEELKVDLQGVSRDIECLQNEAKTVVVVGRAGGGGKQGELAPPEILGIVAIADRIKADSAETVARIKSIGITPLLVTGDNRRTARAVARAVGIDQISSEMRPDAKARAVRRLQEHGDRVAFVGDGINDAPALMQADVGIAIAAGADVAIESADVVLTGARLSAVIDTYEIGKNSYRKTLQNLSLAFIFNGIGVPAAVTGLVPPLWAMAAMVASVTTVLVNSFVGPRKEHRTNKSTEPGTLLLTFRSQAIHCEGCVRSISATLRALPGVESVDGQPQEKEISVSYRSGAVGEADILRAVEAIGYPVDRTSLSPSK